MRTTAIRRAPRPVPPAEEPQVAFLPPTATEQRVALLGLAAFFAAAWVLRGRAMDEVTRTLLLMGSIVVPMAIADIAIARVHRRRTTELDWVRPYRLDVARVVTKLLGLGVTLGVIALAYWVFPEYRGHFFDPFYRVLARAAAPLAAFAVIYVAVVDGRMRAPRDAYWQLGRVVLGHYRDAHRSDLADHARAWLVKAFFLPLMLTYLVGSTTRILGWDLTGATWSNLRLYDFVYEGAFLIDLVFCTVGYVFSFRLFDTHVRSAQPTMLGWVAALLCYQPFFSLFESHYLAYGGPGFGRWLAEWPTVRAIWAVAIIALVVVYVLATVAFGLRFSNLTHRGILTSGPYRFTKHPAYLAKNLSWWLTSVPFVVAGSGAETVRHVLMLLCLNGVYFLRARTEERHLSEDPSYVEYALWMNDHGALRWLGRRFPFLRYTPPWAEEAP